MRLINCHSLKLEEFWEDKLPPYAILSHTWGPHEVSFQEFTTGSGTGKEGYAKIQGCCAQAKRHDIDWVWIDTCCIDKSSSADLSVYINSVFRWYQHATVCYAYLADVKMGREFENEFRKFRNRRWLERGQEFENAFRNSRWFTRGWALQELLAPRRLAFYSSKRDFIGTKDEEAIYMLVEKITGIGQGEFKGTPILYYSVARRMSWASRRQTTRIEDMAYSLLGIFNVNMPLLYGEGERAFLRLQEEIIKTSNDQSLFAWEPTLKNPGFYGFLAPSPENFMNAGHIIPFRRFDIAEEYSMTNRGLKMTLPLVDTAYLVIAIINCQDIKKGLGSPLGIEMMWLPGRSQIRRRENAKPEPASMDLLSRAEERIVYVGYPIDDALLLLANSVDPEPPTSRTFILRYSSERLRTTRAIPKWSWNERRRVLQGGSRGDVWHGVVEFVDNSGTNPHNPFVIVIKYNHVTDLVGCQIDETHLTRGLKDVYDDASRFSYVWQVISFADNNRDSYSKKIGSSDLSPKVTLKFEERKVWGEMTFVVDISID